MDPLVSVIMPVFNGEKFLREAIESILNQTFTNFEFIVVDDGSTDNSQQIINSFTDNRIKLIEQANRGFAKTLNIGSAHCKGKYIARMDQDDISDPDRFLIQYTFLEKHPHISVVSAAVRYINERGEVLGRSFPITWPSIIKKELLNRGSVVCHPCVMFRKSDFENVGGFSEVIGGRFTDYYLWVKFVRKGYKIQNLSSVLIQYRIIENSMSSEFSLTPSAKGILLKVIKEENPDPKEITELNNACLNYKEGNNKRLNSYNNKLNLWYSKLSFLGENTKSVLFSGIKNIVALLRFNFYGILYNFCSGLKHT